MNSCSHCFEYFINFLPLSDRPGVSGFRTSEESRVRRLMITCSLDGMNPFSKARII